MFMARVCLRDLWRWEVNGATGCFLTVVRTMCALYSTLVSDKLEGTQTHAQEF